MIISCIVYQTLVFLRTEKNPVPSFFGGEKKNDMARKREMPFIPPILSTAAEFHYL